MVRFGLRIDNFSEPAAGRPAESQGGGHGLEGSEALLSAPLPRFHPAPSPLGSSPPLCPPAPASLRYKERHSALVYNVCVRERDRER